MNATRTQCNHAHLSPGMVKCPTCGKVFLAVHRFHAFKTFAVLVMLAIGMGACGTVQHTAKIQGANLHPVQSSTMVPVR